MVKTIKNKKIRNKTCKLSFIPALDKDIKAVIDINAIRNNIKYLRKNSVTKVSRSSHMKFYLTLDIVLIEHI
jgi:hypothetical protein